MIPIQTTPKITAVRLRKLIEDAPAGSVFHNVRQSDIRELHKGAANETAYFTIITEDGHSYRIDVERLA